MILHCIIYIYIIHIHIRINRNQSIIAFIIPSILVQIIVINFFERLQIFSENFIKSFVEN